MQESKCNHKDEAMQSILGIILAKDRSRPLPELDLIKVFKTLKAAICNSPLLYSLDQTNETIVHRTDASTNRSILVTASNERGESHGTPHNNYQYF